jgi:hypothetical protein
VDIRTWLRTHWDRVAAWASVLLGAIVLLVGWQGASTTPFPAEQLPYILSGGIGGALLIALGAALLISADLRDEWQKLDRIERILAQQRDGQEQAGASTVEPSSGESRAESNGHGPKPATRPRRKATAKSGS